MRASLLSLSLLLVAGCSGSPLDGDDRFGSNDLDSDGDPGAPDDEPDLGEGPAYWAISGTLRVADGAIVADGSELTVAFFDEDAAAWSLEGSAACRFTIADSAPGPEREPDARALAGWWTVSLGADADDEACSWGLPALEATADLPASAVVLGFGQVPASLVGPMLAAGLDPDLPVYGLYGLLPNGRGEAEYVYGVAGTDEQLAGDAPAPDGESVEDGVYRVRTLALLPLPGAR
jgi:hypothetical protein